VQPAEVTTQPQNLMCLPAYYKFEALQVTLFRSGCLPRVNVDIFDGRFTNVPLVKAKDKS
jgi:hypothetical protein